MREEPETFPLDPNLGWSSIPNDRIQSADKLTTPDADTLPDVFINNVQNSLIKPIQSLGNLLEAAGTPVFKMLNRAKITQKEILTQEEYKKSQWFFPGAPTTDVSVDQAKELLDQHLFHVEQQNAEDTVPDSFGKTLSEFAGTAVGAAISGFPALKGVDLLFTFGEDGLKAIAEAEIPQFLTKSTFGLLTPRVAANALRGGVYGYAFGLQNLAISQAEKRALGETPETALEAALTLSEMTLGGAVIDTITGGAHRLISRDSQQSALKSAVAQMVQGKVADVSPVVQTGYNLARAAEEIPEPNVVIRDDIQTQHDQATQNVEEATKQFKEVRKTSDIKTPHSSAQFEELKRIVRKPENVRTHEDWQIFHGRPESQIIDRALEIHTSKLEGEWSKEETALIEDVRAGKESERLSQIGDQIRKDIDQFRGNEDSVHRQVLQTHLNHIEKRLKAIEKEATHDSPLSEAGRNVARAKAQLDVLDHINNGLKAQEIMRDKPSIDVTPESIKRTADRTLHWRNDITNDPEDAEAFKDESEQIDRVELKRNEADEVYLKDLTDRKDLDEEEQVQLKDQETREEALGRLDALISKGLTCLVGGVS